MITAPHFESITGAAERKAKVLKLRKTLNVISIKDFLENTPVGEGRYTILNSGYKTGSEGMPYIRHYCANKKCLRVMDFIPSSLTYMDSEDKDEFWTYTCTHCQETEKKFAVKYRSLDPKQDGDYCGCAESLITKIGEVPEFGLEPVHPKLEALFKEDLRTLRKAMKCERQGLGKGAFAYYRALIEKQKHSIIDEMIKVVKHDQDNHPVIEILEALKISKKFAESYRLVKNSAELMPEKLKIEGEDPLLLLYDVLSAGIHYSSEESADHWCDSTDRECLDNSTSIRLVMTEMASKIQEALAEKKDLKCAVKKLAQSRNARNKKIKS